MKWNCDLKWNWTQLNFCFENNHVVCRFHCIFRYIRDCKEILLQCCLIMNFLELFWNNHAFIAIVKHHLVIHIKLFNDCRTSSCSSYQIFSTVKRWEWNTRFERSKIETIHLQVLFSSLFYLSLICMFRCWKFVFVNCRCTRNCKLFVLVYTSEMQESRKNAKNIRTSLLLKYWEI